MFASYDTSSLLRKVKIGGLVGPGNMEEPPKPIVYFCPNCNSHYNTQAEADACSEQEGCPEYVCECSNCHTQYKTQAEANACNVQEGCPGYVFTCPNCGTEYSTQAEADACSTQSGCPGYEEIAAVITDEE